MVAASKPAPLQATLLEQLGGRTCAQVLHPWSPSCLTTAPHVARVLLAGMLRFSLPIYAVQTLLGGWRPDLPWSMFRTLFFGMSLGVSLVSLHCFFRFLLGGYWTSTIVFWPSFFAALSLYFEDESRKPVVVFYFVTWVLEWLYRRASSRWPVAGTLRSTTLFFMAANAALMWMLRRAARPRGTTVFWFFKPTRRVLDLEDQKGCSHEGTCWKHGITLSAKYLCVGAALQAVRSLVAQWRSRVTAGHSLLSVLIKVFRLKNNLGVFLGAYVALYQAVSCGLRRLRGVDAEAHALPAGLVAGAAYCLNPELTVPAAALTNILQLKTTRWADRRLLEPLYALCTAVLTSVWLADRPNCPPGFTALIDLLASSILTRAYKNFYCLQ